MPASTTSTNVTGLTPGVTYVLAVYARNSAGLQSPPVAYEFTPIATCSITWTGATDSSWDTVTNWAPQRSPNSDDLVCIGGNLAATASHDVTIAGLTLSGGQVAGSGNVTVTGSLSAPTAFGFVNGPGSLITASGSTASIAGTLWVQAGSWANQGAATVTGNLVIAGGATMLNSGSLTLGASSVEAASPCSPAPVLTNTGTLVAAPGAGNTVYLGGGCGSQAMTINNSGSLQFASGTLDVVDAMLNLNTGTSVSGPGIFQAGPGSSGNSGTIVANISLNLSNVTLAGGTLALAPHVVLHIASAGSFSGTLALMASGPDQFGKLVVAGNLSLSSLSIHMATGAYTPSCGTSLIALKAGALSGSVTIYGDSLPTGASWKASNTATLLAAKVSC